uniref:Uncharacterized protein n=1 Tax=Tanacetum cinerariifolium TaxID=118510 RepID=A0A6L2JJ36_TANCI|nr:hypothetical protein [Tanacetum cinerariifolium]
MINKKSSHVVLLKMRILSVVSVAVEKKCGYGYLKEIVLRRADLNLYKFKEGDFPDLHLNDIKNMLPLLTQNNLFNLDGDIIVHLGVALHMFTRGIVLQSRVEDVQLDVESYQRKLNLTRPQRSYPGMSAKEINTPNYDLQGVIYEDKKNQKILMWVDELHKFSDGVSNLSTRLFCTGSRTLDLETTLILICQKRNGQKRIRNAHDMY